MIKPKQLPEFKTSLILLVDDHPEDDRTTGKLLTSLNCSLLTALNGLEALNFVHENKPVLVLIDMMLPMSDGFELCRQLKNDPETKDLPVIMIMDNSAPGDIIKCYDVGVADYVPRPVIEHELLARVKTQIAYRNLREELAEEITTKNKFLSIISHDLRSSLGVILGFTEILQNNRDVISISETNEMLGDIHHTAENTLDLLENLLQWAKSQNRGIKFNPGNLDLKDLISETIHTAADMASGKNIALSSDVKPVKVMGDRNMLLLIMRNLLSNAIKFTHDGGRITVRSVSVNGHVKVQVSDTGVGIPPEKLNNLFHLTSAVSTPGTRKEQGNGMGLILCREFILHHGGDIGIDSYPGKGTTAWFTIPVALKVHEEIHT